MEASEFLQNAVYINLRQVGAPPAGGGASAVLPDLHHRRSLCSGRARIQCGRVEALGSELATLKNEVALCVASLRGGALLSKVRVC